LELAPQFERDTHRAIMLASNGTELLVACVNSRYLLPSLELPPRQRVGENLTAAMKRDWGCGGICLFTAGVAPVNGASYQIHYQVMECQDRIEAHNARTRWVPVSSLSRERFADPVDYAAVQRSLAEYDARARGTAGPFAKPGCFKELQTWVAEIIRPLGLQLTGPFCQYDASPSFALIRLETDGPAIWFKAIVDLNLREFPITMMLARLFPKYLPTILASRPTWCGWVMEDAGTAMSDDTASLDRWSYAAADLANFQIESSEHTQELLIAGCKDLRITTLLDLVDPFLDVMNRLMQDQSKVPPPVLSRGELSELGRTLERALHNLDSSGVPETLGHSDFNPGNMLVSGRRCVFIDWAEAHIGHPFFTLEYMFSHLRKDYPDISPFEDLIRTAYSQPWKYVLPAQSISEAFAVSPLVAVFAYALTSNPWSGEFENPAAPAYLRSLTRRMKLEADALQAREGLCLK
jgi:hypothetical protein